MVNRFVATLLFICFSSMAIAETTLRLVETKQEIQILVGDQSVLVYNKLPPELPDGVEAIYQRSGFLHPVTSPAGGVVTASYPLDHKHQNGIFSAWVKTNYSGGNIDFWNLAKGLGRTKHDRVVSTFVNANSVGFEVELLHQKSGDTPIDVLRETWKVVCHRADGHHVFDIETIQNALTDKPLLIEEYHYGGMALRGPTEWILPKGETKDSIQTAQMLNNLRSDRIKGNHELAKWVAMTGRHEDRDVYVAVLSHKGNFRSPQPARLHPTKPYFCFAACVGGSFLIDKDNPLRGRYRYLVVDGKTDSDWLDRQWESWCGH